VTAQIRRRLFVSTSEALFQVPVAYIKERTRISGSCTVTSLRVSDPSQIDMAGFDGLAFGESGGVSTGKTNAHPQEECSMASFYDFEASLISGDRVALSQYRGQVCLVVNLASE
jgi:hypothetical protein